MDLYLELNQKYNNNVFLILFRFLDINLALNVISYDKWLCLFLYLWMCWVHRLNLLIIVIVKMLSLRIHKLLLHSLGPEWLSLKRRLTLFNHRIKVMIDLLEFCSLTNLQKIRLGACFPMSPHYVVSGSRIPILSCIEGASELLTLTCHSLF